MCVGFPSAYIRRIKNKNVVETVAQAKAVAIWITPGDSKESARTPHQQWQGGDGATKGPRRCFFTPPPPPLARTLVSSRPQGKVFKRRRRHVQSMFHFGNARTHARRRSLGPRFCQICRLCTYVAAREERSTRPCITPAAGTHESMYRRRTPAERVTRSGHSLHPSEISSIQQYRTDDELHTAKLREDALHDTTPPCPLPIS